MSGQESDFMHSKWCARLYPECACLTCKRDNYGQGLRPCCDGSHHVCGDPKCYEKRKDDNA